MGFRMFGAIRFRLIHLHFKHKVIDVFKQTWYNDVNNSRSLILYKSFKQSFELEHYLSVLPKKFRIVLSQ